MLSEPRLGHFERDHEGDISFIYLDAEVVSGEDLRVGYTTVLLKPMQGRGRQPVPSAIDFCAEVSILWMVGQVSDVL